MSGSARRDEILETAASLLASAGSRTSVTDIAAACGIRAGSLYHHFDSKEAIIVELVERYQADLDRVAKTALDSVGDAPDASLTGRVVELGRAVAACAVRHRAALLLTLYEPPMTAGDELAATARGAHVAVTAAMLRLLQQGAVAGELRPEVELPLLADRLCQSMMHQAVGPTYLRPDADQIISLRCRILLEGLAVDVAPDEKLDRSAALRGARDVVDSWRPGANDDRAAQISAVARAEFGRRGYEGATMREIAAAAGLAAPAVYRLFGSKEQLFAAVMRTAHEERAAAWSAVLGSDSSPVEKLDALAWLNITLLQRFSDEYRIQLGWVRESTPNIRKLISTGRQREQIRGVIDTGMDLGELRFDPGGVDRWVSFVYETLWTPESVVRSGGARGAHRLARESMLRGALVRP